MNAPIFYVYILICADGTFYVGITNNPEKRIEQHNGKRRGGAKYTKGRRPVAMKYFEIYETRAQAAHREYILKQLTHAQKAILCHSFTIYNPLTFLKQNYLTYKENKNL